ncbi:MAG: hypothetical protein A2Z14_07665 [Chloroflexi bacterium RBG_16_48_8]|nr:MAG: hypothetical protein A2Z14_07665 [Chloroflexi bacterium RBG_16_48_8]
MALYYLVFIGRYAALRQANGAYSVLATALAFVGLTFWFSTHSAFSMVYLSDQYAVATIDILRSQLLAAGEAILASNMWNSTGGFMANFLLIGSLLISVVMLQYGTFNKLTACAGILANGLDLSRIMINLFLPGNPADILMAIAGPLYPIWFILLGRRLLQLGRSIPKVEVNQN